MYKPRFLLAAVFALASLVGCESMPEMPWNHPPAAAPARPQAPSAPALTMNGILVAPGGITLYTFDKDPADSSASACNGPCAELWKPLAAGAGAAPMTEFTLVAREDGTHQWAWKGKPLYTYAKDLRGGDMAGDNFKGIWHVVPH